MKVKYSSVNTPAAAPPVSLKNLWMLEADESYDVKKNIKEKSSIIALRTMDGLGRLLIENHDPIDAHGGTLLFFKHNMVRRYYCSGGLWVFNWYEFCPGTGFSVPLNTVFQVKDSKEERRLGSECFRLLRLDSEAGKSGASAAFCLLVSKWLLQFEHGGSNPYKSIINEIVLRLHSDLSENLSVEDMSKIAGLSNRRFHDVFIKVMGVTPKKYVTALKIKGAEELLKNTPFSIAEISDRLGYSSQFHFCNAFKRSKKITPSQYRKKAF